MATRSLTHHRNARHAGYSFTEVMFAVIVLGIGFIMVAAVFPVAIQQSQTTSEETTGASIARGAVNYLQSVATNVTMPETLPATVGSRAQLERFRSGAPTAGWETIRGNLVLPSDPRYAWVAFYKREFGSSSAQVIVIPVQSRVTSTYDGDDKSTNEMDTTPVLPANQPNLYGRPETFTITDDGGGANVDTIAFSTTPPNVADSVAEGCFVLIGADPGSGPATVGYFNGRIFRVGVRRTDLDTGSNQVWELSAGNDFTPEDSGLGVVTNITNATGFVVGKQLNGAAVYEGPAQDIGVYTTFIQVK